MHHHTSLYRIYLLTVWQHLDAPKPLQSAEEKHHHDERGDMTWRFTLEDPRTGQRRGFTSLVELAAALQAEFPDFHSRADP